MYSGTYIHTGHLPNMPIVRKYLKLLLSANWPLQHVTKGRYYKLTECTCASYR